ncbi:MAG: stage V sporulation protein AA, partial [Lachnospiraceae bacterium]|nr:stage V sporulation protein AA [Lachnospiraceae bacterium]
LVMGTPSDGLTILEISYSIGLAFGILVFFNHFASWKLTVDPTPIEVEMRTYETNVNKTLIQNDKRRERGIDVS